MEKIKNRGKTTACYLLFAICYLFFGCDTPMDAPRAAGPLENGYGKVSVALTDSHARTVFPGAVFDNYIYTFTKTDDATTPEAEPVNGVYTLAAGAWKLEVTAYTGAVNDVNKAAEGEVDFILADGENKQVRVPLTLVKTGGTGKFSYGIQYPEEAEITTLTLISLAEPPDDDDGSYDPAVTLYPDTSEPGGGNRITSQAEFDLEAGFYLLSVELVLDTMAAGKNEVVYIYDRLVSEFGTGERPVVFTGEDFARPALTGTVTIAGTAQVGQTLIASVSDSNGTGTPSYQWARDASTAIGEDENIYILVPDDLGQTITVTVSYQGYVGEIVSDPTVTVDVGVISDRNLTAVFVAPAAGETPDTTTIDQTQYTGVIEWKTADDSEHSGSFSQGVVYKTVLTLTPKNGLTLTGIPANAFSYVGATSVINTADSGTVTITFPATKFIIDNTQTGIIVEPSSPDLKVKFGITAVGAEGVASAFSAVHAYLATNPAVTGTGASTKIGDIALGDYVSLESPSFIVGGSSTTFRNPPVRFLVVGINSFSATKVSSSDPTLLNPDAPVHIVFHFWNVTPNRQMGPGTRDSYLMYPLRDFVVNALFAGLTDNAGVPDAVLWAPIRRTANQACNNTIDIPDVLWVPTMSEMGFTGAALETVENQGRLDYYIDDASRIKAWTYWTCSPNSGTGFYQIASTGALTNAVITSTAANGVSPAFCVK